MNGVALRRRAVGRHHSSYVAGTAGRFGVVAMADRSGVAASVGPVPAAPPDACSTRAAAVGEPLAGTAVADDRWLLLEQPGPWGPKVPRGGDLDEALATALADRCEALGIRPALLRRSVAREEVRPRTAFLACTRRGATWLERHALEGPADVLDLDLEALGAGRPTDPAARWTGDVFAVCGHGERDPCCARLGRPLHRALQAARPEATWQTSHLGGHRFAPTLVHLPSGVCLGRVPAARAREVAETLEAGRVPVDLLRGRVGDPWAVQAAEALFRAERGLDRLDDVAVLGADGDVVTLRAGDEVVRVEVGREPLPLRPASCGKAGEPAAQAGAAPPGPGLGGRRRRGYQVRGVEDGRGRPRDRSHRREAERVDGRRAAGGGGHGGSSRGGGGGLALAAPPAPVDRLGVGDADEGGVHVREPPATGVTGPGGDPASWRGRPRVRGCGLPPGAGAAGAQDAAARATSPSSARAMTSRWISLVPS